jgi:hypothetical protein
LRAGLSGKSVIGARNNSSRMRRPGVTGWIGRQP